MSPASVHSLRRISSTSESATIRSEALDALARGHIDPTKLGADGFPYHAEDVGRQEITHDPADAFRFRVLTMRQLKDGRNFFHNAAFTKVRDVVEYFNAGVPQDPTAGAAPTLSPRFTNPRGPGTLNGLGLSEQQVDDITDFLENALYDPALVNLRSQFLHRYVPAERTRPHLLEVPSGSRRAGSEGRFRAERPSASTATIH